MFELKKVFPEEVGIPSKAIENFVATLEKNRIPMHGIMIARHGKLAAEGYYQPYKHDTLHRMFSVTKSFTSLAIGLLEQEGKIRLTDKICSYFPEYLPGNVHPWLAEMTIEDMLQMRTCYNMTTYNKTSTTENWVRSFFQTVPTHRPGTVFMYDTSASHTMCALVEKLTGQDMLSYLKDRILRKIGFSEESYIIKDPFGTSIGGSGLMARPEDLLRVGLLLMNGGKDPACYGTGLGDQLYPWAYIDSAVTSHVSPIMNRSGKEGYGYQIWRLPDNGYGFCGMGDQLLMCYPDRDLVVVTTADTQGVPGAADIIYRAVSEELLDNLSDTVLEGNEHEQKHLTDLLASLKIPALEGIFTPDTVDANSWNGKVYPVQLNPAGFKNMGIQFKDNRGSLNYTLNGHEYSLPFGFGYQEESMFPGYNQKCVTSGAWLDDHTLRIVSWLIDECVASVSFKLYFKDDTLTVQMAKTEETKFTEYQGFINS